jgi:hypothetical protein
MRGRTTMMKVTMRMAMRMMMRKQMRLRVRWYRPREKRVKRYSDEEDGEERK